MLEMKYNIQGTSNLNKTYKKYHFIVHTYVLYTYIHVIKQMITPKYLY